MNSHACRSEAVIPARRRQDRSVPTPGELRAELTASSFMLAQVSTHRQRISDIVQGRDERLLVIVGPCSIHDPEGAVDYARRLARLQAEVGDRMVLVMRSYFEKPRTTIGWKGLLHDPHLDGTGSFADGLRVARTLMLEMAGLGLPLAVESLNPLAVPYLHDLVSWTAIGARTTESQTHREMASDLDTPVGFKNGTDGGLEVALNAMQSATQPHDFLHVGDDGRIVHRDSQGNADVHLVLRGGNGGANHDAANVAVCRAALNKRGLNPRMIVDCSHDNSGKDHRRQPAVLAEVLAQRKAGNRDLVGVMLESYLEEGKQTLLPGTLRYGVSVTDACLGWDDTAALLRGLP